MLITEILQKSSGNCDCINCGKKAEYRPKPSTYARQPITLRWAIDGKRGHQEPVCSKKCAEELAEKIKERYK